MIRERFIRCVPTEAIDPIDAITSDRPADGLVQPSSVVGPRSARNIQSGQTIGLPVGPDTSLVIAESVLCEVDHFIQGRLPSGVEGFRFVDDPVAVLMALYAEQEGKLSRALTRSQWDTQVTPSELFDSKWLLVYEGVGQGWLNSLSGDPASSDPFFADARARSISFFDTGKPRVIPNPSPAGEYG